MRFSIFMEACHQILHEMEQDVDETVMMAFTEKDSVQLALALACLCLVYPCLTEESHELQMRMKELLYAQRPDWMVGNAEDELPEGPGI